ncbi:MAG: hypothetical protein UY82_C0065G0006 [Candidatus Uhrbacteria bacterium GW2011_GWC2_53_7]|uniref:Uncharacterized protein n=1 Tax=Candidatus Uhrbacteria bacterium GW2011_GWC2_53_7 TaxID=1618986 RepID=A0A0G1XTY4_9BACT|nr:MAG: hypothetical protein UY82_C0065G0006 [Candidatus Uhrbacteria bacterium GW2011_GWC2_53_7]
MNAMKLKITMKEMTVQTVRIVFLVIYCIMWVSEKLVVRK